MRTPGTSLDWHTLNDWIICAHVLMRRRGCAGQQRAKNDHWRALAPVGRAWIDREPDQDVLADMDALLNEPAQHTGGDGPWLKPRRGFRGGTQWELFNMAVKNRIRRLEREADDASMGLGHNRRAVA